VTCTGNKQIQDYKSEGSTADGSELYQRTGIETKDRRPKSSFFCLTNEDMKLLWMDQWSWWRRQSLGWLVSPKSSDWEQLTSNELSWFIQNGAATMTSAAQNCTQNNNCTVCLDSIKQRSSPSACKTWSHPLVFSLQTLCLYRLSCVLFWVFGFMGQGMKTLLLDTRFWLCLQISSECPLCRRPFSSIHQALSTPERTSSRAVMAKVGETMTSCLVVRVEERKQRADEPEVPVIPDTIENCKVVVAAIWICSPKFCH